MQLHVACSFCTVPFQEGAWILQKPQSKHLKEVKGKSGFEWLHCMLTRWGFLELSWNCMSDACNQATLIDARILCCLQIFFSFPWFTTETGPSMHPSINTVWNITSCHLSPIFTSSLEHSLPYLPSFCPCLFHLPAEEAPSPDPSSNAVICHAVSWRQWKGTRLTRRKDTHIQNEQVNATPCWQSTSRLLPCQMSSILASSQSPEPRIIKKMNFMMQKPERTSVFYRHLFSNTQLFIQEAVRDHCSPNIWRAVPRSVWQSSLFSLLWSLHDLKRTSKNTCKNPGSIAKNSLNKNLKVMSCSKWPRRMTRSHSWDASSSALNDVMCLQ